MEILKNSKINGELVIKEIPYDLSKKMILENHYSKKWNTSFGKLNFGIFRNKKLLGCAVFGNLMNPKSYKSITDMGEESLIELNRLWVDDCLLKNTETIFLSSCFKIIRNKYPQIKYVQSFADGRLGCGTIYKAANFKYYGVSESLFFEDKETKETFHRIPLENTKRPYGFLYKNRKYIDNKLIPFKVKTYRYIYSLTKNNDIKLTEMPYPKYNKGYEIVDYKHPIGLMIRLYLMYNDINDTEYANKCKKFIKEQINENVDIKKEIEKQKNNESYKWFKNHYIKNQNNLNKLSKQSNIFFDI